ncbi:Protein of unknown function (DUF581 [Striga hermonthica]|uniref:FLZ-type domain-containing protein n=1 Tax=Striga hermonthica TaxID=68872 RepID=A0A9N7RBS8_STRHE|nr:Protein of unknown function (DUF581 [Striga hermonthica]
MRPYYSGSENRTPKPHFLDSCSLCHRQLSQNSDIYMYRGNTPFCSQECRQEQIAMDEGGEKKLKLSSKRSNGVRQNKDSAKESAGANEAVRTGTVAVA